MKKIIYCIFLVCCVFVSKSFSKNDNFLIKKIILVNKNLYFISQKDWKAELIIKDSFDNQDYKKYLLPVGKNLSQNQFFLKWDIYKDNLFIMEIVDLAPLQRLVKLKKMPLKHLQKSTNLREGLKKIKPEKFLLNYFSIKVKPLMDKFLLFDFKGIPQRSIFYDFSILGEELFELYILADKKMEIWEYNNSRWRLKQSYPLEFERDFWVVRIENDIYFIFSTKEVYSLSEKSSKLIKIENFNKQIYPNETDKTITIFIADRDNREVLLFSNGSRERYTFFSNRNNILTNKKEKLNYFYDLIKSFLLR